MRTLAITGGALLSAALIGIGGFKVVDATTETTSRAAADYAGGIRHIVVNSPASVSIRGSSRTDVHVERTMTRAIRQSTPTLRRTGDTLTISGGCNGRPLLNCQLRLDIEVPASTELTARTDDGSLTASGLRAAVTLQTTNGRIDAADLHGPVHLRSDSGRIDLDGAEGGPVDARSQSSRVTLRDLRTDRLYAHSSSGRVSAEFARPPAAATVTSSSGEVRVAVPDERRTHYRLAVQSDRGQERLDDGLSNDDAATHSITARSSSGRVSVGYR